jgi:hypothetical protein
LPGFLRTFIRINELEAALARVTRRVAALEEQASPRPRTVDPLDGPARTPQPNAVRNVRRLKKQGQPARRNEKGDRFGARPPG